MSEIQQNRYDQLLRRVADLKGPGSKVSWAVGDLLPIIDVENVPPELLLPMGSKLCMGEVQIPAGGVGNFNQALLHGLASGSLARVIAISAITDSAQIVRVGPTQQAPGPIAGTQAFSDTRVFGEGTTFTVSGFNNLLTIGGGFFALPDNGTDGVVFFPPYGMGIASPDGAWQISTSDANTLLIASFMWVERVAQPSELSL